MPRFHWRLGRENSACLNKQLQAEAIKNLENANAEVCGECGNFPQQKLTILFILNAELRERRRQWDPRGANNSTNNIPPYF